jgi:hypothetical protein
VYDREEDCYLYCLIREIGLKGWKERVPQYFSSSDREWAKRQARELDPYEFRQATIKRYLPDMKYGRQDVINVADRFDMEISGLKPYMGKKDALRTFRDFLTPYEKENEGKVGWIIYSPSMSFANAR